MVHKNKPYLTYYRYLYIDMWSEVGLQLIMDVWSMGDLLHICQHLRLGYQCRRYHILLLNSRKRLVTEILNEHILIYNGNNIQVVSRCFKDFVTT